MKLFFLLLILPFALFAAETETLFIPGADHPFTLFSSAGELSVSENSELWPESLKITTDGRGSNIQAVAVDLPVFSLDNRQLVVWIKPERTADLGDLWIYASDSSDFSNRIVYMISRDRSQLKPGEWNCLSLPLSAGSLWGNPDLNRLTSFQFWLNDSGSKPISVEFGPVVTRMASMESAVIMTFDDGWESQITLAAPIMEARGQRGVAYIIPSLIGSQFYLNEEEINYLRDEYGWDIGVHHMERLDGYSRNELHSLFMETKEWFTDRNMEAKHFSYPNGAFSRDLDFVVPEYFSTARTIIEFPESLPPADKYKLKTLNIYSPFNPGILEEQLDSMAPEGELLILVFHKIEAVADSETELTPADFERVCDMVAASGFTVKTLDEVYQQFEVGEVYPPDWNGVTLFQPIRSGELSPALPATAETEPPAAAPLNKGGAGKPEIFARTQLDFSLDWRMVWGIDDEGDWRYYTQIDDMFFYVQSDLSDSARLFGSFGIKEVNIDDFTEGNIGGDLFTLNELYLEQQLPFSTALAAGYFNPDPFHKWLQVTRADAVEPAFGDDMTPQSIWIQGSWSEGDFGYQFALVPDLIGVDKDGYDHRVLTYQNSLGLPNLFTSFWYDSPYYDAEIAAALNGDALKIAAQGGFYHDFASFRLSGSLGAKYTMGDEFSTWPEWDHLDKTLRLSTGWSIAVPVGVFTLNPGVAYRMGIPSAGKLSHYFSLDMGVYYRNMELYALVSSYDITAPAWGDTIGMETGLVVDFDGVDYIFGYTMSGFHSRSGLYNNKVWENAGVDGVFLRIKATYW